MKERKPIRVTILDDSCVKRCEGRCGLDLSTPGRIQSISDLLKKLYGENVCLDYHDLGDASVEDPFLTVPEEARPTASSLPLLLVNGKPRISGYFDLRQIQDVIQAEIEMISEKGQ